MITQEYCKCCGIQLPNSALDKIFSKSKVYTFADGKYCENCAKAKVDKARKEQI